MMHKIAYRIPENRIPAACNISTIIAVLVLVVGIITIALTYQATSRAILTTGMVGFTLLFLGIVSFNELVLQRRSFIEGSKQSLLAPCHEILALDEE